MDTGEYACPLLCEEYTYKSRSFGAVWTLEAVSLNALVEEIAFWGIAIRIDAIAHGRSVETSRARVLVTAVWFVDNQFEGCTLIG